MSEQTADREQQGAELELMQAAFGDTFHMEDESGRIRFTITLYTTDNMGSLVISFFFPQQYPSTSPLCCIVDGTVPNAVLHDINKRIQFMLSENTSTGSMEVYQLVNEQLNTWVDTERSRSISALREQVVLTGVNVARFLIYFHHIMSSVKRKAIVDNAHELQLGGISKTGFPGIVIVEGQLDNVLEYVRRIQRLRWQQMVVRGEDIEALPLEHSGSSSAGSSSSKQIHDTVTNLINTHRKIKSEFYELDCGKETGAGGMSAVGAFCKRVGLHALFMTAMKKYEQGSS